MGVTWTASADKHGIPHDEALYSMAHAVHVAQDVRSAGQSATLFIGPSRFGTLEVLAEITPPDGVMIFHVMRLRESTRTAVGYEGD
ncbi:hypothetical protein [Demequina sp.]|uniref:hypothetical protein n=1 Tax=Demequina sp. TaxID=2050685 RepID=UPI003D11CE06